jgi:hypothetical protein
MGWAKSMFVTVTRGDTASIGAAWGTEHFSKVTISVALRYEVGRGPRMKALRRAAEFRVELER